VQDIPFQQTVLSGCCDLSFQVRGDRSTLEFTGTLHGDSLSGAFREGSRDGQFAFRRGVPDAMRHDEREISFQSGNVTLAGTLILPQSAGRVPVVVFLHGSGAESRWASRYLANQSASRGIASFIYDKRGVGTSTGDWRSASPDDLVQDAVAAVARILEEPRVDSKRVGIHGHSQGGTLAPMVAVRSPHVAFVVASAAAGQPMDSVELYSVLNFALPNARTARDSADAIGYATLLVKAAYWSKPRTIVDSLAGVFKDRSWFFPPPPIDNPYWTFSPAYAMYQPLEWWQKVRVPVLLIYGAEDKRVPPVESSNRIHAALAASGNRNVTTRIIAGADHTFRLRPGPSGWSVTPAAYTSSLMSWLGER